MSYDAASFWVGAFSLIHQIISSFPARKKDRTPDQEAALIALSEAYHATEGYYAYLKIIPATKTVNGKSQVTGID